MGRLIDCQMAFVTWGAKARYRQGKLGLLRKNKSVYLAFFFTKTEYYKLPIHPNLLEISPAAIRFKAIGKDLFVREVSDEERYKTMMRGLKVLLKYESIRRSGKGEALERFIESIPTLNSISLDDRTPVRQTARFINRSFVDSYHASGSNIIMVDGKQRPDLAAIFRSGNDLVTLRQPCGDQDDGSKYNSAKLADKSLKLSDSANLKCLKQVGFSEISKNLWSAQSLQTLQLIGCNLVAVPKELENLSGSLENLDLSRNSINTLPRTFCCKMNKLRSLNIGKNSLESLPIEIKFLSELVALNLSDNHLKFLPSTFSDLRNLKTLVLANNNLSQLPAFRRDDIRLQSLDISGNPLDGALNDQYNTFEVHPSYDGQLGYEETAFCPTSLHSTNDDRVPKLFEISILKVVRCDRLFKLASEESLPSSIVSIIQRDIFKCFRCGQLNILPAYNTTDCLEYVDHIATLTTSSNYRRRMTFMKLLCRSCFRQMSS